MSKLDCFTMADSTVASTRSKMMAAIRGKDTRPELMVRSALHAKGYRYRLHLSRLPGKPDIVLASHKAVVFVHGCFWHRHNGCHWCTFPKTRTEFWQTKFALNIARDASQQEQLLQLGWRVATVWECATKASDFGCIIEELSTWLKSSSASFETALVRSNDVDGLCTCDIADG